MGHSGRSTGVSCGEVSSRKFEGSRALVFAAIASVLMGVGVMIWAFFGAAVISAIVGVAALARGVTLMMSSISEHKQMDKHQAVAD